MRVFSFGCNQSCQQKTKVLGCFSSLKSNKLASSLFSSGLFSWLWQTAAWTLHCTSWPLQWNTMPWASIVLMSGATGDQLSACAPLLRDSWSHQSVSWPPPSPVVTVCSAWPPPQHHWKHRRTASSGLAILWGTNVFIPIALSLIFSHYNHRLLCILKGFSNSFSNLSFFFFFGLINGMYKLFNSLNFLLLHLMSVQSEYLQTYVKFSLCTQC